MIVGILKEIKPQENRVCMTPAGVDMLKASGLHVLERRRHEHARDAISSYYGCRSGACHGPSSMPWINSKERL